MFPSQFLFTNTGVTVPRWGGLWWGSRSLCPRRGNSFPHDPGNRGCADALWEMKEVHTGQVPGYRLRRFSQCFNFPGSFLHYPASPGPIQRTVTHTGDPRSRQLSKNWEFRDVPCPGFAEGGGVVQGAIAQVRLRSPPQTAGLTWGRRFPEKARQ